MRTHGVLAGLILPQPVSPGSAGHQRALAAKRIVHNCEQLPFIPLVQINRTCYARPNRTSVLVMSWLDARENTAMDDWTAFERRLREEYALPRSFIANYECLLSLGGVGPQAVSVKRQELATRCGLKLRAIDNHLRMLRDEGLIPAGTPRPVPVAAVAPARPLPSVSPATVGHATRRLAEGADRYSRAPCWGRVERIHRGRSSGRRPSMRCASLSRREGAPRRRRAAGRPPGPVG